MTETTAAYSKRDECVCHGSKMADANKDGEVTEDELRTVATKMFGTIEKFESYIADCGGAEAFYDAVTSGKLKH